MSAADDAQWLRDRINAHAVRLGVLLTMDRDREIPCPRCHAATARSIDLCGCGGVMTVAEAIEHHKSELEVLGERNGVARETEVQV